MPSLFCEEFDFLLIESDSKDATLYVLEFLSLQNQNFRYLSLGNLRSKIPERTERLSFCRNIYLEFFRSFEKYQDFDALVVADFDNVNDSLTLEGVQSCFVRNDWDVCTANQHGPYYDIWALRHSEWSPGDCWMQFEWLKRYLPTDDCALYAAVYSKMITISPNSEWIQVESAFGGLGIYKRNAVLDANYNGIDCYGNPCCEHVPFHQSMRLTNKRIFINPRLINSDSHDSLHTRPLRRFYRFSGNCHKD